MTGPRKALTWAASIIGGWLLMVVILGAALAFGGWAFLMAVVVLVAAGVLVWVGQDIRRDLHSLEAKVADTAKPVPKPPIRTRSPTYKRRKAELEAELAREVALQRQKREVA